MIVIAILLLQAASPMQVSIVPVYNLPPALVSLTQNHGWDNYNGPALSYLAFHTAA
jgi:hypothetical protein